MRCQLTSVHKTVVSLELEWNPRMNRLFVLIAMVLLSVNVVCEACDRCNNPRSESCRCEVCGCQCCPCQMVNKTILVPMCITETRMKACIVKTEKERTETYTVFKRVPVKREYTTECCYMDTEIKSKEITKSKCRRVKNDTIFEDTIKVPTNTEIRHGTRCREVCTLCGKVCIEEPCTCCITRAEDEPRSRNCIRNDVVFEECKKTIDYCVKVPKFEKKTCGVETIYKLVPVEKTCTVTVCVPEIVKRPVDIKVQRKVAKQVCCCKECACKTKKKSGGKKKKKEHGWMEKCSGLCAKVPNPFKK